MLREWPVCPRPAHDESLPSWFERVGREYGMSATALLNSIEPSRSATARSPTRPEFGRLRETSFAERLAALSRLSDTARTNLWCPFTGWELSDAAFRVYCPRCALEDLETERTPYGRQCWQQSWYTICQPHGIPLVVRERGRAPSGFGADWSVADLRSHTQFLAPDRYRDLKVAREAKLRCVVLGSLLEIERAVADALAGISPNRLLWGNLSPQEFLLIAGDVTTWSLTHFEPVRAWSVAEDRSPVEEQEAYGLVGRIRRQSASDYTEDHSLRTLRDMVNPKVRGSALWVAHALISASHEDASDRRTGSTPKDCQAARILRSAPAGREWLADRQQLWPRSYCRGYWIDVRAKPGHLNSPSQHNAPATSC